MFLLGTQVVQLCYVMGDKQNNSKKVRWHFYGFFFKMAPQIAMIDEKSLYGESDSKPRTDSEDLCAQKVFVLLLKANLLQLFWGLPICSCKYSLHVPINFLYIPSHLYSAFNRITSCTDSLSRWPRFLFLSPIATIVGWRLFEKEKRP